ncbi:MAG: glycosyltransferase family 4 protein [Lachnospiraceae bacterium]|nr:glycosyltransferase family 4 protein [Lachnospiraceae bacterium]
MRVTFVSNYINHHQMPFCEAMYERLKEEYCFIQTEPMEEERVKMGWDASLAELPYVRKYYEEEVVCKELIEQSDVVLFGGVEDESYITERLKSGKPVVRLSERIYKEGQWKAVSPRGLLKKYKDHTHYRSKPVYLLCCGGYVASDFHIVRAYPEKMFQWGYFPELVKQDIDELLLKKRSRREREGKFSLLWAGRFIDWKHPEHAIEAAARLKQDGFAFTLTMVGGGEMEETLRALAEQNGLADMVRFTGYLKPAEVRKQMEQADVYLFTSDYKEGWGAVLNEAMNSGCAVVANCAVGAAPFLLKPGRNGLIYPNGRQDLLYERLTLLFREPEHMEALGREAYRTIAGEWNAAEAAKRLISFLQDLTKGGVNPAKQGILSPAPIISPKKMYQYMTNMLEKGKSL